MTGATRRVTAPVCWRGTAIAGTLVACALVAGTPAQTNAATDDLATFRAATDPGVRGACFARIAAGDRESVTAALRVIDDRLTSLRGEYTAGLQRWLPDAYTARLIALEDEQIMAVQRARRTWRDYVLHGGHRANFQNEFLAPMQQVKQLLLIEAERIEDATLRRQRAELVEFAGYQQQAHEALGIDFDPTRAKVSPTGIPYPHLDQPPTFLDRLRHAEQTLVLAHTVAPPGARPVLLFNDRAAAEIDVQEAEYVLFGNEMRLLAGTIAWQVDPLGNAVARDHSEDRTKGLAQGHMSSIPEKRGFTHRSRRMGAARFGSEGVGGGRSGRGYIHGLSYGGGHTGPLYSLKRNVVGVGRRGSAYTSIYRTDRSLVHDCQAVAGELALPPGWDSKQLRGTPRKVFQQMRAGRFGRASKTIETARAKADESTMLLRFLRAAIDVEADHALDSAAAIAAAGDVYEAQRRLVAKKRELAGVLRFDVFAEAPLLEYESAELADELRAGAAFHRIALGELDDAERAQAVRVFGKRHAGTVYAEALDHQGEGGPFAYFLDRDPTLEKYGYPPRREGR